jgi:hypothetical protein
MGKPEVSSQALLGGIAFVLSGALYLIKSVLDFLVGDPPSTGPDILVWRSSHEVALAWTSEVLFFATVLLIPGVIALYRALDGSNRAWVAFGCGTLAAIIPTLFTVLVVHGRLAFPIYGITIDDPATAAQVVSLYYGGLHAVSLLLACACVILGFAMRGGTFGPMVGIVGIAAGAAQVAVAYPWLVAPGVILILQSVFAAWLLLIGWRLAWTPRTPAVAGQGFDHAEP